ncbi:uncharacterized protein MYCFIDRAFT_209368 [Pseudocercospora fijiensis CIRAD86]|uniref:Uncharacterized protein n=1 Tax=Pseudocercospora fijiensis (strain CIRAD86) TaxID=383855 RepID=M3AIF4_PSEFD|nr:uncharacterized protein MYCFIDRAFT_209368 [Pseudocercospora fijiensis CIRAD86]EME76988.1 hypothetical protein MYCFIDRAFT_209368 [Pseudocercospora fijiensis CIRAD86]
MPSWVPRMQRLVKVKVRALRGAYMPVELIGAAVQSDLDQTQPGLKKTVTRPQPDHKQTSSRAQAGLKQTSNIVLQISARPSPGRHRRACRSSDCSRPLSSDGELAGCSLETESAHVSCMVDVAAEVLVARLTSGVWRGDGSHGARCITTPFEVHLSLFSCARNMVNWGSFGRGAWNGGMVGWWDGGMWCADWDEIWIALRWTGISVHLRHPPVCPPHSIAPMHAYHSLHWIAMQCVIECDNVMLPAFQLSTGPPRDLNFCVRANTTPPPTPPPQRKKACPTARQRRTAASATMSDSIPKVEVTSAEIKPRSTITLFYGLESSTSSTPLSRDDALSRRRHTAYALPALARWQTDRLAALLNTQGISEASLLELRNHRLESQKIVMLCVLVAWPWWTKIEDDEEQGLAIEMVYEWLKQSYTGPDVTLPGGISLPSVVQVSMGMNRNIDDVSGEHQPEMEEMGKSRASAQPPPPPTADRGPWAPTKHQLNTLQSIQDLTASDLTPKGLAYRVKQEFDAAPFQSPTLPELLGLVCEDELVLLHSPQPQDLCDKPPGALSGALETVQRDGTARAIIKRTTLAAPPPTLARTSTGPTLPPPRRASGGFSLAPPKIREMPARPAEQARPITTRPVIRHATRGHAGDLFLSSGSHSTHPNVDDTEGVAPGYPVLNSYSDSQQASTTLPTITDRRGYPALASNSNSERVETSPSTGVGPEYFDSGSDSEEVKTSPSTGVGPEYFDSDSEQSNPNLANRVAPEERFEISSGDSSDNSSDQPPTAASSPAAGGSERMNSAPTNSLRRPQTARGLSEPSIIRWPNFQHFTLNGNCVSFRLAVVVARAILWSWVRQKAAPFALQQR